MKKAEICGKRIRFIWTTLYTHLPVAAVLDDCGKLS